MYGHLAREKTRVGACSSPAGRPDRSIQHGQINDDNVRQHSVINFDPIPLSFFFAGKCGGRRYCHHAHPGVEPGYKRTRTTLSRLHGTVPHGHPSDLHRRHSADVLVDHGAKELVSPCDASQLSIALLASGFHGWSVLQHHPKTCIAHRFAALLSADGSHNADGWFSCVE